MPSRPAQIKSAHLDAAALSDITDAIVRAVAAAVPTVPAAVANQIRVEAERAVKDISVAASAARRTIQTAVQDGVATISAQQRQHEEQTNKLVSARKLSVERSWLAASTGGLYYCLLCTKHANLLTHTKQQRSQWIAGNCGVNPVNADSPFRKQVQNHEDSDMHKVAVQFEAASDTIDTALGKYNSHSEAVTVTLMRTAIDCVVHYRAFNDYENVVYLHYLNGLDVGDWQHGRQAAAAMLGCCQAEWEEQMGKFLSTESVATGHRPYLGIAADKVSDSRFSSWQPVCGRVNYLGIPISFLMDLYKMTVDCTGNSCWVGIKAAEEKCNVVPEQSISFAFDGEAAYQGEVTGVKSTIAIERPRADVVHDYPHAGELLKEDMQKQYPYCVDVQDMLRQIYSLFSKSPKQQRFVQNLAENMDPPVDWKELHYVFEIRMVESEATSLRNFLVDLPAIVEAMKQNLQEASTIDVSLAKQRGWLRQLQQFKFVVHCLLMLDQDNVLRIFSQSTQSDSAYALEVPGYKEHLVAGLKRYHDGAFGPELTRNLAQLKSGKFAGMILLGAPGQEEEIVANNEWEDGGRLEVEAVVGKRPRGRGFQLLVKWLGWENSNTDLTWEARSSCRNCLELVSMYEDLPERQLKEHPDGGHVVRDIPSFLSRLSQARSHETRAVARSDEAMEPETDVCSENVERRIKQYQKVMVGLLLANADTRLPIPKVVFKFRDSLDFRRMLLVEQQDGEDPVVTWGGTCLEWIVREKLPHLDKETVLAQATAVRIYVKENQEQWKVDILDDKGKVVGRKLKLSAVYETLFRQNVLQPALPPCSFLTVLDYSIAYRFTQCDTERLGRVMNLMKTAARSSLGDINFAASVYVTYNAPPINHINFQPLLTRFRKKHRLAVMSNGGTREKQVIRRHEANHKNTFLT